MNANGPYIVIEKNMVWYTQNTITGATRKFGPVQGRGANFYDKAMEYAKKKNAEYADRCATNG